MAEIQKIRSLFNRRAREELNFLLTEPPLMVPTGLDLGFFCREHAVVTCLLGRMSQMNFKLKLGHYLVRAPSGDVAVTLGTGGDHAWCASESVVPIDLSMTFRFIDGFAEVEKPVIGTGRLGAYSVQYSRDMADFRRLNVDLPSPGTIAYLEESEPAVDLDAMLARPSDFLLPTAAGQSLVDGYGPDILGKIAVHVAGVSMNQTQGLAGTMLPRHAIRAISAGYPDAVRHVQDRVGRSP